MALFPIRFSEKGRGRLGVAAAIVNLALVLVGVLMCLASLYIKMRVEESVDLMEDYDHGTLTTMLIAVGCLIIAIHGIGGKMAYDSGYPETRERFQSLLLLLMILYFVFTWVVLAAGCLCYSHVGYIEKAFQRGLFSAMKHYHDSHKTKLRLDHLQMRYACCGSDGYADWFQIGWVNKEYLNLNAPEIQRHVKEGNFLADQVPFSCCDPQSPRPCIHHHLSDASKHQNYDPETGLTLYSQGCVIPLGDYFENNILVPLGTIILLSFGVQWIALLLVRYLQTSIDNAYEHGDGSGISPGWLLEQMPCTCLDLRHPTPKPTEDDAEKGYSRVPSSDAGGNSSSDTSDDEEGELAEAFGQAMEGFEQLQAADNSMDAGGGSGGDDGGGKGKDKKDKKDKKGKKDEKGKKDKKDKKDKKSKDKKDKSKKDKGKKDKSKKKDSKKSSKKKDSKKSSKKLSSKKKSTKSKKSKSKKKSGGKKGGKGKKR